ncbi:response regulator transcription factor [Herbihabitans rhizosphaerae]|uniref:response regulator transcription factor n=1 Tax=Herbihabitans rhizosphaerae TaxID=1872711 RepID=UPI00102AF7E2|nr:response regulator transcription factor [Herbihabitans rhizosphaerae]
MCADSEIVRSGMAMSLAGPDGMPSVLQAADIDSLIAAANGKDLTLVIDGRSRYSELARYLASRPTSAPGLVLVAEHNKVREAVELLDRGLRGVVGVEVSPVDLCLAVKVVSRGSYYIHSTMFSEGSHILNRIALRAGLAGCDTRMRLTARERDVLHLLAQGRSNDDIASLLTLSQRTVKYHVSNLLAKLGARNRWEAVTLAFRLTNEPVDG